MSIKILLGESRKKCLSKSFTHHSKSETLENTLKLLDITIWDSPCPTDERQWVCARHASVSRQCARPRMCATQMWGRAHATVWRHPCHTQHRRWLDSSLPAAVRCGHRTRWTHFSRFVEVYLFLNLLFLKVTWWCSVTVFLELRKGFYDHNFVCYITQVAHELGKTKFPFFLG